jgi:hypothetical protein
MAHEQEKAAACPFCGESVGYRINACWHCAGCHAEGPPDTTVRLLGTEETAIAAWNRRAAVPEALPVAGVVLEKDTPVLVRRGVEDEHCRKWRAVRLYAAPVAAPAAPIQAHSKSQFKRLRDLGADVAAPAAEAQTQEPLHPRTADLVDRFAAALKGKLAAAEKKYGYTDGWADSGWMDECRASLIEHAHKGDPRDVAAYCAFLWHHGERTALEEQFIYDTLGKWPGVAASPSPQRPMVMLPSDIYTALTLAAFAIRCLKDGVDIGEKLPDTQARIDELLARHSKAAKNGAAVAPATKEN